MPFGSAPAVVEDTLYDISCYCYCAVVGHVALRFVGCYSCENQRPIVDDHKAQEDATIQPTLCDFGNMVAFDPLGLLFLLFLLILVGCRRQGKSD
jgi:hypothetical protein